MSATKSYVRLAKSLPPLLLRFFTRYQPQLPASTATITSLMGQSPTTSHEISSPPGFLIPSSLPNPFKSQKNSVTGRWQEPIYSLRRQAVLVKLARAYGVEELLPPTTKGTEIRTQKRAEHGLRVKGTGVGQRVKGKRWERTQKGRLQKRKQAMLQMPQMIHDWKQVSCTLNSCDMMILTNESREDMDGVGRNGPNDLARSLPMSRHCINIFENPATLIIEKFYFCMNLSIYDTPSEVFIKDVKLPCPQLFLTPLYIK